MPQLNPKSSTLCVPLVGDSWNISLIRTLRELRKHLRDSLVQY